MEDGIEQQMSLLTSLLIKEKYEKQSKQERTENQHNIQINDIIQNQDTTQKEKEKKD